MKPDTELARPSRFDAAVVVRIFDPVPQKTRSYSGANDVAHVRNHKMLSFEGYP